MAQSPVDHGNAAASPPEVVFLDRLPVDRALSMAVAQRLTEGDVDTRAWLMDVLERYTNPTKRKLLADGTSLTIVQMLLDAEWGREYCEFLAA